MQSIQAIKIIYYAGAIAFHFVLFFTDAGNYFHGGTPVEWIALQVAAVLIAVTAIKLLPKVGTADKVIILLCAVVPAIYVIWSLIVAVGR